MNWFISVRGIHCARDRVCAAEMVQSRSHVAIALDPCVICHDDRRSKSGSLCCADSLSDMDAPNVIPAAQLRCHDFHSFVSCILAFIVIVIPKCAHCPISEFVSIIYLISGVGH